MKKLYLAILFPLLLVSINCSKTNIEGFWAVHFPMPSGNYGYLFYENNYFYYYEYDMINTNSPCYSYFGKWKLFETKIYIKPLVRNVAYFNKKNNNEIEKISSSWINIGDYKKLIKSHQVSNKYFTGEIPDTLDLLNINTKKYQTYFHLYNNSHDWHDVDYNKLFKYYMKIINK